VVNYERAGDLFAAGAPCEQVYCARASPEVPLISPRRVRLTAIKQLPVSEIRNRRLQLVMVLQKAVTVSDVLLRKHPRLVTNSEITAVNRGYVLSTVTVPSEISTETRGRPYRIPAKDGVQVFSIAANSSDCQRLVFSTYQETKCQTLTAGEKETEREREKNFSPP
jgi:hypothetical protein